MATTTAVLPGLYWRESEFVGGLTGACGPNAISMAASWSLQRYTSTLDVFTEMHHLGLCDANGVSTIGEIHSATPFLGLTVAAYRAYAEPWDYAAFKTWALAQLAAGNVIVIEVAHGQSLVDAISEMGENARNLRYHFFTIVGYVSGRWVCLDGDNLAVGNFAQHYTDDVIAAALPCAALAIEGKAHLVTTTGAGAGFDAYCSEHGVTAKLDAYIPLDIDQAAAVYDNGLVLWWHSGEDISDTRAGTALLAVNAARVTAASEAAALRQQLATVEARAASLALQLAQAEAKAAQAPAPVPPTPAPAPDPADEKFRTAIEAMRAALAALAA